MSMFERVLTFSAHDDFDEVNSFLEGLMVVDGIDDDESLSRTDAEFAHRRKLVHPGSVEYLNALVPAVCINSNCISIRDDGVGGGDGGYCGVDGGDDGDDDSCGSADGGGGDGDGDGGSCGAVGILVVILVEVIVVVVVMLVMVMVLVVVYWWWYWLRW